MRIFEAKRAATLEDVSWLRKAMGRRLEELRVPAEAAGSLQLVLSEVATNAVVHGRPKPSLLKVTVDLDGAEIKFAVYDDGGGFYGFGAACNGGKHVRMSKDAESGRGMSLIQKSLDRLEYQIEKRKNCFTGWKNLRSSRLNVLVVEDVPSLLEIYCQHLQQADYLPIGCTSLGEARKIIRSRAIDAVLTDFHLGDGIATSLLEDYDALWPEASPPIIFVSADKSPQVKDAALRFGAEFFVEKPVKRDQLIETIKLAIDRSIVRSARMTRSFGRHVDALVSPKPPKAFGAYGLEITAATATLGGGDILLHHKHEDFNRLIIIDVMGHGIPAKAWAVAYAAIINTLQQERDIGASEFLTRLSTLAWNDKSLENALATVMVLDVDQEGATVASAGHPPPMVLGKELLRVSVGGPLLGVMPPCPYRSSRVRLDPGDRLAFFTDGVDPVDVAAGGEPPMWLLDALKTSKDFSLQQAVAAVNNAAVAALGPQPNDDWLIALLEKTGSSQ